MGLKGNKGGAAKGRVGGGGKVTKVKAGKKLQTSREHIVTLRQALFEEDGRDRDVLRDFTVGWFASSATRCRLPRPPGLCEDEPDHC